MQFIPPPGSINSPMFAVLKPGAATATLPSSTGMTEVDASVIVAQKGGIVSGHTIQLKKAGLWLLTASVGFAMNGTGSRQIELMTVGTNGNSTIVTALPATDRITSLQATMLFYTPYTDLYAVVRASQTSGGSLDLFNAYCSLSAYYLGT